MGRILTTCKIPRYCWNLWNPSLSTWYWYLLFDTFTKSSVEYIFDFLYWIFRGLNIRSQQFFIVTDNEEKMKIDFLLAHLYQVGNRAQKNKNCFVLSGQLSKTMLWALSPIPFDLSRDLDVSIVCLIIRDIHIVTAFLALSLIDIGGHETILPSSRDQHIQSVVYSGEVMYVSPGYLLPKWSSIDNKSDNIAMLLLL
jgi:hypothetical protein